MDAEHRENGLGKVFMGFMCKLALDRNCQILEWGWLDWNAPTIQFYRQLGAYSLDEMTIFRFSPKTVKENAKFFG